MAWVNIGRWVVCIAMAGGLTSLALDLASSQEEPSAAQIVEALKPKGAPGGATRSISVEPRSGRSISIEPRSETDRRFLNSLRNRQARSISIEERAKAAEIAKERPSIDLEITFDYDSDVIGSKAIPTLLNLGTALRSGELKGAVFLLAGHTDAKGDDAYNQTLSERRADAVRRFLVKKFSLASENLVPIGFGKAQLKNATDPNAGENRRVQIVNTEMK
jgi:outer membrane protein OmpA-like peptidoglycan-associated protein